MVLPVFMRSGYLGTRSLPEVRWGLAAEFGRADVGDDLSALVLMRGAAGPGRESRSASVLSASAGGPVRSWLSVGQLRRRLCVRPDDVLQFLATSYEFLDDWLLWRVSSDSLKVSSIG